MSNVMSEIKMCRQGLLWLGMIQVIFRGLLTETVLDIDFSIDNSINMQRLKGEPPLKVACFNIFTVQKSGLVIRRLPVQPLGPGA